MKVYITEMLRRGSSTGYHHYIVGVFSTKSAAEYAGHVEEVWRAGKYSFRVLEQDVDAVVDVEKLNWYDLCARKEGFR